MLKVTNSLDSKVNITLLLLLLLFKQMLLLCCCSDKICCYHYIKKENSKFKGKSFKDLRFKLVTFHNFSHERHTITCKQRLKSEKKIFLGFRFKCRTCPFILLAPAWYFPLNTFSAFFVCVSDWKARTCNVVGWGIGSAMHKLLKERASERGFLFKDILAPFLGSNKIIRSGFLFDVFLQLFCSLGVV